MAGTTKPSHPTAWSAHVSDMMQRHKLNPHAWALQAQRTGFDVTDQAIHGIINGDTKEPSITTVYALARSLGEGIGQFYPHYSPNKPEHALALHFIHRMARLRLSRLALAALLDTSAPTIVRFISFQQVSAQVLQRARVLSRITDDEMANIARGFGFTVRELSGVTSAISAPPALLPATPEPKEEPEPEGDDWKHPGTTLPAPRQAVLIPVPQEKILLDLEYTHEEKPAQPKPEEAAPPPPPPPTVEVATPAENNFETAIWSIVQGLSMLVHMDALRPAEIALANKIGIALEYVEYEPDEETLAQLALLEIITEPATMTADKFRRILKGVSGTITILGRDEPPSLGDSIAEAVQAALEVLPE